MNCDVFSSQKYPGYLLYSSRNEWKLFYSTISVWVVMAVDVLTGIICLFYWTELKHINVKKIKINELFWRNKKLWKSRLIIVPMRLTHVLPSVSKFVTGWRNFRKCQNWRPYGTVIWPSFNSFCVYGVFGV